MRILVLALAAILCGCQKAAPVEDKHEEHGPAEAKATHVALTDEAAKTAGIVVEEVRRVPMQAEIKAPGVVSSTASGRALVTPPVDGKITRLLVTIGDTVKQGQPLAVIESPDLALATSAITEAQRTKSEAEADLLKANSELNLARGRQRTAEQNLSRQRDLVKSGAFSQPSVQEAESRVNEAESELQAAKEDEAVHKVQLDRAERLFAQELISRSDLEEARLALKQDQVKRAKAERSLDLAIATLDRERQIASKGLLNAREIQAAEAEVRAANLEIAREKIGVQSARSAVEGAQRGIANAQAAYSALKGSGNRATGSSVTMVAPIDGVIAHRDASVGQAVERTTELFEIDNLHTVWITASVPESQIESVKAGSPVQVRTASNPDRVFPGIVQVLGTRLDPKTRSLPVQCVVQNPQGHLKPGMFAEVRLGFGSRAPALAVPRQAILTDGDDRFVYVADKKGGYEKRGVTLGRTQGQLVEVLAGLELGQRVVVEGGFILKSQAKKEELKGHED